MTRKKFVKQLMAMGYQRNSAEGLAIYARCGGWTYEQYLEVERKYDGQMTALAQAAEKMVSAFIPALYRVVEACTQVVGRIREAFIDKEFCIPDLNLLDWARENAPQIKEQDLTGMVDAMAYVAHGGGGA